MNRDTIRIERVAFHAILLFLFCFFVQLLGFPNKFALLGSFSICAGHVYKEKNIQVGYRECLLLLGMFFYAYISGCGLGDIILITGLPFLFMLAGKYLATDMSLKGKKEYYLLFLLAVFVIGYLIHGVLNSVLYFRDGLLFGKRMWGDIWGDPLLATHQNIYMLPALSLMFPAFVYLKKYKAICISLILIDLFFLYQSISSLSRIPIMIWGILMIWGIVLFMLLNRRNGKTIRNKKKVIVGIGIVLAIAVLLVGFNINTIKNLRFIQVLMHKDGGIIHNIRFQAQANVIRQLFVYPMGGCQMDLCGLEHAHNVWLDIANAAGVVPFFILLMYTIVSMVDIVRFLRNTQIGHELKYIVSGLYISLILYYMVEPALMANIRFFIPWPYLNGIIRGCNIVTEKNARLKSSLED